MERDFPDRPPWWRSRAGVVALCVAAIAAFFLLTEQTAPVFGALPYLLILACLLIHFFLHHGHHGSRHAAHGPGDPDRAEDDRS